MSKKSCSVLHHCYSPTWSAPERLPFSLGKPERVGLFLVIQQIHGMAEAHGVVELFMVLCKNSEKREIFIADYLITAADRVK